ncbi:MAG: hypothetical protein M3529_12325, partial [Actinomycetota bacterium]|nr:hypothetical protein [Actinomycetota bacterium]
AVPLWLVGERHFATDAPMLGWVLAAFSLAAGLGAVLGGVAGLASGMARPPASPYLQRVPHSPAC